MSRLERRQTTTKTFKWEGLTALEAAKLLWRAYQVEIRSRNCKFEPSQELRDFIMQIAEFMTDGSNSSKFGIWLNGTCGNGKTTLVKAIQDVTNLFVPMFSDKGLRIMNATDIADMAKTDSKSFLRLKQCTALGIEDLGTEPAEMMDYGNILSPMVDLLEFRYNRMLTTFVTTNLTYKEITERYGKRIADRRIEMFHILRFTGSSYRKY